MNNLELPAFATFEAEAKAAIVMLISAVLMLAVTGAPPSCGVATIV